MDQAIKSFFIVQGVPALIFAVAAPVIASLSATGDPFLENEWWTPTREK